MNGFNSQGTPAQDSVISFVDVHKRYGSVKVLEGLNLQVQRGEVFGFLGKNGAGKSTAIRMLMGITEADQGDIALFGQSIVGRGAGKKSIALRRRIGYVAQEQNFYGWMTPRGLAGFVSGFYPSWDDKTFLAMIDDFDLPHSRKISTFSGGMKAKLGLSVALATRPELLVLDEPTAGMDPVARREFLDLVREQAQSSGATIFFSTHLIDEIEAAADRIAIVDHGRALYVGSLETLANSVAAFSIDESADNAASLPGEFGLTAQSTLRDEIRRGRRQIILKFKDAVPLQIDLDDGWQRESLTLEDIFVAVVSAQ
ncbi:MAG: ABC transporter ATP-binding protein [Granulosicoccus sp.]|nr:ABC transporter ATP-binding protein [Granulosicoccus sp.]